MTKIYDEVCGWPYHQPYGMVAAPKVKKPRKPRKSRAMPAWLKEQRKVQRTQPRHAIIKIDTDINQWLAFAKATEE